MIWKHPIPHIRPISSSLWVNLWRSSHRALRRCASQGLTTCNHHKLSSVYKQGAPPTWTQGRESMHQQRPQGTPQVYKRGVPSAHGRKRRGSMHQQKPQGTPQ
eukprot:scaffold28696_cov38-Phaeocystis_antarctica.AAC.1